MEFDSQSQCSDEGVELSVSEHGRYCPEDFLFSQDIQPEFLEAKIIYLLLPKNVPVSRAARLQWLLDHLNTTISLPNPKSYDNAQHLEVISAIPREQNPNLKCNRFLVTYRTELKFVAHSYRFVYCLDMSPSHSNVDLFKGQVLFDEILQCFKNSIHGLSKQFTVPGNTLVFQPCIYLTIMANTPFFITPAQQVILKGIQMTPKNVTEIIKCVETHFHMLEGKIADVCATALDQIDFQRASYEGIVGDLFDIPESRKMPKIPMVTPDANFVNMLRYSMLAISLLPETTLSHILVITDGIVAMPDSNVMETLLFQLHYDAISVSFLKVGSNFRPNFSAGFVFYTDLLYFFSQCTLGTCLEIFPAVTHDTSLSINIYQEIFLLWSFHSTNNLAFLKNCDSSINESFFYQKLPTLLSKRQTEESTNASILLLLARRMREGFTVDNIFYMNNNLEIKLILQWKASIYIHYNLSSTWPTNKNSTHFEVHVSAPYEFLHDMTCLIKKEIKSAYRQVITQRFWSRLSQLSSGDLNLACQLSGFQHSKDWYTLPESVKNGISVFTTNNANFSDSIKLSLSPRDTSYLKFANAWQNICQMETNNWRKWFHVHKISLILRHDTPLPKHLHVANSSQRYQVVQCRQAVTALYEMLREWSSFALLDNHTYVRLLLRDYDKSPIGFCIIRVSSKFPCAVLNLAFSTNTSGFIRHRVCEELKIELSSLSYLANTHKNKGAPCCVLLQKPLEKILIRYERIPSNYTTVIFPDGTQPPQNSNCFLSPVHGSLFTTLSRYLFHKRWIWSATYYPNNRLSDASLSRILNILTRIRLNEGYSFAHSSSGIVTMVLEVTLEPQASCIVQYVLFPPHCAWWGEDYYSTSDDENEHISDVEGEMQMITEVWIEPHHGKVIPTNSRINYIDHRNYYQIADAISRVDFRCINVLLTMEHMSLMCQDKSPSDATMSTAVNSSVKKDFARRIEKIRFLEGPEVPENGSPWYPIVTPRIEHIPFKFDPVRILPMCRQTELLFSVLKEEKRTAKNRNTNNANSILLDSIFQIFRLLHSKEIELDKEKCDMFTQEVFTRHVDKSHHSCPLAEKTIKPDRSVMWKCFLRGVSVTHVILTFLPASVEDLVNLVGQQSHNIPVHENVETVERTPSRSSNVSDVPLNTPNSACLPIYVYDCPLKLLINSYIDSDHLANHRKVDDYFEDHRFKFSDFIQEDCIRLNSGDANENSEDTADPPDLKNVKEHCTALVLSHLKCFTQSLFMALHMDIYVHISDVQAVMDMCEDDVIEIDITEYISHVCAHLKQNKEDKLSIKTLHQAHPCSELKPLHMLIKDKFFKMIASSFNRIPTHSEYYYYKHISDIQAKGALNDSDDEISVSDVEFKSEKDFSTCSEALTELPKFSELSPLFLHLICTLRYNDGGHANTSIRLLPTCLGELIQNLDSTVEYLESCKLRVTLDILCLTLPPDIQNITMEYSAQGLRTTSFCSEGIQRSISSISDTSCASEYIEQTRLRNLSEPQKKAVVNLCDEIKWILTDEICATLLDLDSVDNDTFNFVTKHVLDGYPMRITCRLDKINLNFVYTTSQSRVKFIDEFSKMALPEGYKLCQKYGYYYFCKSDKSEELIPIHDYQDIRDVFPLDVHELFKADSPILNDLYVHKDDTISQQSDISTHDSEMGTDGGYDEDISEDDDNFDWLNALSNKRPHLPNFWLIMKVEQDMVTVYFHCRFLELPTTIVDAYLEIEQTLCDSIRSLCKKVNQLLLLQSLYETKTCDLVLEPDDSPQTNPSISRNPSYNKLKHPDDSSDDSDLAVCSTSMSEASLNFKPGYFSCPIVWEKSLILHPRLKSGSGGKSNVSRGILALKNFLDKFSVLNRHNMFVYSDNEGNVFYLRLYESVNGAVISKNMTPRTIESENELVSRSPSIVSLPLGHKHSLAQSDQSISSIVLSDIIRPRVRSFGERESRTFAEKEYRVSEDLLVLRVHGITTAGSDVRYDLVQVLQNRLDDAVLDFLSVMLARNAMCPLTPEDVHFIQKPFHKPDQTIRMSVQQFALEWLASNAFAHYLKQNLLQFLNVPKYTDARPEYHFNDYTETEACKNIDNIFIYNQSRSPSSGSCGIACIALAIVYKSDVDEINSLESNIAKIFETAQYERNVSSKILESTDTLPNSYLEFRLWKQGKVNIENLSKKLKAAVCQATWDVVTEYYLLQKPLCEEKFKPHLHAKPTRVAVESLGLDLQKEVEFICELNLNAEKNIKPAAANCIRKKVDTHLHSGRKYGKRIQPTPKTSRAISYDIETDNSLDDIDSGVLSVVYSKHLPSWLEFGHTLNTPSVKQHKINLANHHLPLLIVKELVSMLEDHPKAFRATATHSLDCLNKVMYVPFVSSNYIRKYAIVPRNFHKTEMYFDHDVPDIQRTQKFAPASVGSLIVPRDKFFWISVETDSVVIYTYNWAKDSIEKLISNCHSLSQWLCVRSCFLSSVTSQKLGLFHNQPLTRKCFMLSSNNYLSAIGNLDMMTKFPKDHLQKKPRHPTFNLLTVLEAFRDSFCTTKYTSNDITIIFTIEMREMKSLEKKTRDEMKKLHSMYQSRTGTTSVSQLNLLMQNSRILHYCHTPLLFLPRWRLKCAATRDHSLYPSQALEMADKLADKHQEHWHTELCYSFFCEYRNYLHTLMFTPLQIDCPQGPLGIWLKDKSAYNSVFYVQRTIIGGILIFTASFNEPFFVTKLHAIECNRLQNISSRASVNGFTLSFLDECDKVKIFMHLHSFAYDYHLRSMYNYLSGLPGKLCEKYNVRQFLDHFLKYYNKAPNFARNLVHTDMLVIEDLVTEGKQLFDYLLINVGHYGFKVLEIDDCEAEFILVKVSTNHKISYKDSQDQQHTDDFDVTVVVSNVCAPFKPTDNVLHLIYYLILTSKRETYPTSEIEKQLGKFRTVSSTYTSYGTLERTISDAESSLTKMESNEESGETTSDEMDKNSSKLDDQSSANSLPSVAIYQESVNYLGYYSSHEQLMQKLIMEKAKHTQNEIRDMVAKGMIHCRTNLLWNRLISPQETNLLTFEEFIELKNFAKLRHLGHLYPNLGPLLNHPLAWYQGLAKLLLVKYADQHRQFSSSDGNVVYYVILHPRYFGAFMLLSLDFHTSRGDLYVVYREPHKQEDADPLGMGYQKSLCDGFVNCICFYLWSGMISN